MRPFTRYGVRGRFPRTRKLPASYVPPMAPRQQFAPRGEAQRSGWAAIGLPSRALNAPLATTYADVATPPRAPTPLRHLSLGIMGNIRRQRPPLKSLTDLSKMRLWSGWLR